jgi:hypothetical protein
MGLVVTFARSAECLTLVGSSWKGIDEATDGRARVHIIILNALARALRASS